MIASNIPFANGDQHGTFPSGGNQESVRDIISETNVGASAEVDRVLEKRDGLFPEADNVPSQGGGKDATPATVPSSGPTTDNNRPDPAGLVGRHILVNWREKRDCAEEVVPWRPRRKDRDDGECEHRVIYDDHSGAWSRRDIDRWHYLRDGR